MTTTFQPITVPVRRIRPPKGWLPMNWAEIWRFRELLYFLTWRDVKVRYKQTVLGVLWAFIQPFLKLVVFSVIFGKVAKLDSEGVPYPIFLYAGLLPWQFFSEALSRSSTSVIGSTNLITKVYFPRLIIPLSSVGACLVDFLTSFAILFGLMLYYHISFSWQWFWIAPLVLLTVVTTLAFGVWFSSVCVTFRDFRYVLPFLVQIWMYVTPVVYPVKMLPAGWQWVLALNPMTGVVNAYRAALLGRSFDAGSLALSLLISAILFVFGLYYFRRMESRFADIV
jgi:lipopolysaccharide transport system permease protein